MNIESLKKQMVQVCHRLDQRQLVANHDGNVTYRLGDGTFLATPTSFAKVDVTEADILRIDATGAVIEGRHKVFSEALWHLAIYRVRPDVNCVVHGHPVTASAFGLAGREIGTPALPEAIVSLGRAIRTVRFFSPLDSALKMSGGPIDFELTCALSDSDAFVAVGNGAWTVGQDLMQTYLRLELVEHVARQHQNAHQLGVLQSLPEALVNELLAKRPKISMASGDLNPPPGLRSSIIDSEAIKSIVREELKKL